MKKITKVVATAAATIVLLSFGVTTANATTAYPEGGTWNYGVSGSYTTSDYYHGSRTHKSTAVGATTSITAWTSPGVWARAKAISALGGNKAYYDVK
ncbi:lactococcin 972 family bacteriocin [Leifsonia sp. 21MFCrub1.1]|uniref:lactococcin 972 family bacteriocin n=1 Tax=Leifsonia sp. 21MFCrub1.1 TaxID=1798223 RepID=UPI0008928C5F|nr:lactococcin 972 family bacteriocin [Leifsonia sp. 21MFCrub1.1]SEA32841.1 bacteriocin, lactococcin 972 family [Leifsonia sp. 21MFCrub1.1]